MTRRTQSSERWLREHFNDRFVKQAHAGGWRSRAVFKLEEVDQQARLLKPGMLVLDLGAAPGAWSQYARGRIGRTGRVVASDILPMDAIPGVEFVVGDFREQSVMDAIMAALGGAQADVLLSDMAPNQSGIDSVGTALKPGGNALIKVFQGTGFQELVVAARQRFARVRFIKPEASRARSAETYLLASGRRMV